ncbi:MAG: urate hydroxylase PuuD [Ignavibacteriales bacterium]|nr:urate hydroxylase PuuD [Ignavibacteriales bacterium]
MEFDWNEWLHIITRWVHVFAGILWIGTTYFFTWLDGRFHEMADSSKSEQESKVWMVHSGGFYVVGKQSKPSMLTTKLHWFKWEAAITWLSGMLLLVLVYYTGGLLVDAMYDETTSILIGLGSLVVAWFVYDVLWNSALGANERVGVVISFVLAVAAIYAFSKIFGGRTAYMQAGAMFGTLMAANVWIRILPGQRKMVAALQRGDQPDLTLGARAKARSKHNTFMIVPVVFIMISNHYPVGTYSSEYNWLILSFVVFIGWVVAKYLRRA